jgi:hypothetical protein
VVAKWERELGGERPIAPAPGVLAPALEDEGDTEIG